MVALVMMDSAVAEGPTHTPWETQAIVPILAEAPRACSTPVIGSMHCYYLILQEVGQFAGG